MKQVTTEDRLQALERRIGQLEEKRAAIVPPELDQPYVHKMIYLRMKKAVEILLAQARDVAKKAEADRNEADEMLRLVRAIENYEKSGNRDQGEFYITDDPRVQ